MRSKKKWLRNAKLYLILDAQVNGYRELLSILKESVDSGVDIVQLRDKQGHAKDILQFIARALKIIDGRIPLIVNDRVDVALLSGADGVHVGQEDISVEDARRILGADKIIGLSCQTLSHVEKAAKQGADYVGFGSIFKTLTKPQRTPMNLSVLKRANERAAVPLFAIGGIGRKNVGALIDLGVSRVAVCRDVCLAKDVSKVVAELKRHLERQ